MSSKMSAILPKGLENIGNTCFANSVVQCLMHTKEMYAIFDTLVGQNQDKRSGKQSGVKIASPKNENVRSCRQKKSKPKPVITQSFCCTYCSLQEIFELVTKNKDESVTPTGLFEIVKKAFGDHVQFGLQQDAHEFLIMLLHTLQDSACVKDKCNKIQTEDYQFDFNNALIDLKMQDVFEGSFTSKITCNECNYNTENCQKFQDVCLDVKESFDESMSDFFRDYKLEGDNKYDCTGCGKYTNATKSICLEEAPVNLIVSLKRFDKFGTKIKSGVDYPNTFKLSDYTSHSNKIRSDGVNYELYAVINHEGRFSIRGHYNCYVKGYDQNWYICDDSKITKMGNSPKKSTKAYILFYKMSDEDKLKKIKQRRSSDASTNDADTDDQSYRANKSKSTSKVNRKRKRSQNSNLSIGPKKGKSSSTQKNGHGGKKRILKKITRSGSSQVSNSTASCRKEYVAKRRKITDIDYFQNETDISIEI